MEEKTCIKCGKSKRITLFATNKTGGTTRRQRCRACCKANNRRSIGIPTRAELVMKRRAVGEENQRARRLNRDRLLRAMRACMSALLYVRCDAAGLKPNSMQWAARYRNDDLFRVHQIARTWARKALSPSLRTDRRWDQLVPSDGTLDRDTLVKLFLEAVTCPYCGVRLEHRTKSLDHVRPVSRGGHHSIRNVVVCCRSCNVHKHDRTVEEMGWQSPWSCTPQGTGKGYAACGDRPTAGVVCTTGDLQ